jgi:hypothetical protein
MRKWLRGSKGIRVMTEFTKQDFELLYDVVEYRKQLYVQRENAARHRLLNDEEGDPVAFNYYSGRKNEFSNLFAKLQAMEEEQEESALRYEE